MISPHIFLLVYGLFFALIIIQLYQSSFVTDTYGEWVAVLILLIMFPIIWVLLLPTTLDNADGLNDPKLVILTCAFVPTVVAVSMILVERYHIYTQSSNDITNNGSERKPDRATSPKQTRIQWVVMYLAGVILFSGIALAL
jgi:hypothetical protein